MLLSALGLVNRVVEDRESYKYKAIQTVAGGWASSQEIYAPLLAFKEKVYPLETYKVQAKTVNEYKKIGIFKIPVYSADITLSGTFLNDIDNPSKKASLSFGIQNPKSFISRPEYKIAGQDYKKTDICTLQIAIPEGAKTIPFEIKYKIKGADRLSFQAPSSNSEVFMESSWANPGFDGDFLPSEKTITSDGFSAKWNIPKIATSDKAQSFGVSFLIPVDNYRMTTRAVKYGALFLLLTFTTFFIFEILTKNIKVHPIQYILIGSALVVFYLLLLSLSESAPFWAAYLCAGLMTIGIIAIYSLSINKKLALVVSIVLTMLYAYLYTLLNLESLALLFGSLGLFIIIALVMFATRKIEWYK